MSDSVIEIKGLSKRYRLGLKGKRSSTFAGQVIDAFKSPITNFKRLTNLSNFDSDDESVFWALRDITFSVKEGEILGIIGRNGAGKSTLLKILSRITEPTSGGAFIKGRVASLLEVGTGFHPELTGRENIYMNGTILGMTKKEINLKLDEIVDFSGVEKFLDTPVKFYSSGMKVRLGFSVAAHLDPEILIIDEVLAVGDHEFQRKCLGKMEDVSKGQGRTVLFVSHSMASVRNICEKVMVLESGSLAYINDTESGINFYLSGINKNDACIATREDRTGSGKVKFTDMKFYSQDHTEVREIISGDKLSIEFKVKAFEFVDYSKMFFGVTFLSNGQKIAAFFSDEMGFQFSGKPFETVRLNIPRLSLRNGIYQININISESHSFGRSILDFIENAGSLIVLPGDYWKVGKTNRSGIFTLMDGELTLS